MFDNITIVLVGTLKSGNIGSVARAMNSMGLKRLFLVNPQCSIDDQAFWMATHGRDVLKTAETFSSLREALSKFSHVFGTTARDRRYRNLFTPVETAAKISGLARSNKIAIIFGPEDSGLSNDELEFCQDVICIPTISENSSLNISHAVMIVCYELFKASGTEPQEAETADPAPVEKVEAMYDHMRNTLLEIGYLNPQNPDHIIGKIRRIFSRTGLHNEEVNIIRGVFRQLGWYIKRR